MDNSKIIDLIAVSRAIVKRAGEETAAAASSREKVAAEIPAVVSELIRVKALAPRLRKQAEAALRDPVQSLRMIVKMASLIEARPAEPTPIGSIEQPTEKQASAGDDGLSAADAAYHRRMDTIRAH